MYIFAENSDSFVFSWEIPVRLFWILAKIKAEDYINPIKGRAQCYASLHSNFHKYQWRQCRWSRTCMYRRLNYTNYITNLLWINVLVSSLYIIWHDLLFVFQNCNKSSSTQLPSLYCILLALKMCHVSCARTPSDMKRSIEICLL